MEPITWALLLTLVATKATEKVGEQIGEGAIASAKHLVEVLRLRSPETVLRLEAAGESSDANVIDVKIIEEVMRVAADEPDVQAAVDATAAAVEAEPQALQNLQNLTKLAEKIGVVNLGNIENQTNTINL